MIRIPFVFAVTVVVLVTASCTAGLYMVDDPDASGIPFFVKTAMCRQETVYEEPRYTVTLIEEVSQYAHRGETLEMGRERKIICGAVLVWLHKCQE